MHQPSAFVAGAGGPLRRALLRELARRGARAAVHVALDDPDPDDLDDDAPEDAGLHVPVERCPWRSDPLAAALERAGATHVFALLGTAPADTRSSEDLEARATALWKACRRAPRPPRVALLSSLRARRRSRAPLQRALAGAERGLIASGLPHTIARPGRMVDPERDSGPLARVLAAWAAVAGALGLARHASRHRPILPEELAHGLVHAAFNYTTIDRVVMAEELRYELANDREHHLPRSRRDELRH